MVEVSVIVPAYNVAHSLPSALSSVRNQSMRDLEILVVDDASQDQTYDVAMSVASADDRVRVIRRTTNGGPSAARNTALDVARGEWIALLDADDLYLPQRLSVMVDAARATASDMVADNIMLRCPDSGLSLQLSIPIALTRMNHAVTPAEFARQDRPFPGGFSQLGYLKPLIRRSFLQNHRLHYDTDIWIAEDFVLYMKCLLAGAKMIILPDSYYLYSLNLESISRSDANLQQNYYHLKLGSARVLVEARRCRNRGAIRQLKRRQRNIAFLGTYRRYKAAVKHRRWAYALANIAQMPFAPAEFLYVLSRFPGFLAKQGSFARRVRWWSKQADRVEERLHP